MTEHPHQLLQGTVFKHERADIPSDIRCDVHLTDHRLCLTGLKDSHIVGLHHILLTAFSCDTDTAVDENDACNTDLITCIDIKLCAILLHVAVGSMHDKWSVFIFCHKEVCLTLKFYLTGVTTEVDRIDQTGTIIKMYARTVF